MSFFRYMLFSAIVALPAFGQTAQPISTPGLYKQPEALVRSLYRQVVARHPIGIPEGAEMKIFAPFMSSALLHRIETAKACEADWERRNPPPTDVVNPPPVLKPPFGRLESGLFSGPNEEALPRAFSIEKTESEKDGSLRVFVNLRRGKPSEKPWVWHVVAIVVRENNRFLVDDVINLRNDDAGLDADYRLSETLSRDCNGSHWVKPADQEEILKR